MLNVFLLVRHLSGLGLLTHLPFDSFYPLVQYLPVPELFRELSDVVIVARLKGSVDCIVLFSGVLIVGRGELFQLNKGGWLELPNALFLSL